VEQAVLTSELPFRGLEKSRNRMGARYGLYGGCSNGDDGCPH
jgi:hypothetical protein